MAEISIIVPVYNAQNCLRKCIDSILVQNFTDWELLLIDDGSTDAGGQICEEYAMDDKRIKVFRKENGGVSTARNLGIVNACGTFIAFIDSDDFVGSSYLEELHYHASDLTICGMQVQDERGIALYATKFPEVKFERKHNINFAYMYEKLMLYSPYCKLFRRDIIEAQVLRFPENISWGEDGMFVADYLCCVESIKVIEDNSYYYVKHDREERLSTRIREDVVEQIVAAREYCIEKMRETSPDSYEYVKLVCAEDIKRNCADFIVRLFRNRVLPVRKKIALLERFLSASYAQETRLEREKYYAGCLDVQTSLGESTPRKMICCYQRIQRGRRLAQWGYRCLYAWLPECVKQIYRELKRKVRR